MLCLASTGGRCLTPQPHLSTILRFQGLVIQEADVTEADLRVQRRQTKGLSLLRDGERVPGIGDFQFIRESPRASCLPYLRVKALFSLSCLCSPSKGQTEA